MKLLFLSTFIFLPLIKLVRDSSSKTDNTNAANAHKHFFCTRFCNCYLFYNQHHHGLKLFDHKTIAVLFKDAPIFLSPGWLKQPMCPLLLMAIRYSWQYIIGNPAVNYGLIFIWKSVKFFYVWPRLQGEVSVELFIML